MEQLIDVDGLAGAFQAIVLWLRVNIFTLASLAQLAVAVLTGALAFWLTPFLRRAGRRLAERAPAAMARSPLRPALHDIVGPLTWFILLNIIEATA